jgi:hypothetical protein
VGHTKAQKAQEKTFVTFVTFVALSEPTDDRETFATHNREDFVKRLGSERDQHPSFAMQSKTVWTVGFGKVQRTATKAFRLWFTGEVIQKDDDRYSSYSQVIEVELMGVAILVANEKVTVLITQKLRPLTIVQSQMKVLFQGCFLLQQALVNSSKCFSGRMEAGGFADCFVNQAVRAFDVDWRLRRR